MKSKSLFTLLPLLALVSCASKGAIQNKAESPFVHGYDENGIPTAAFKATAGDFVTYLMMGPFGYLSMDGAPQKGVVSDLFYENTIIWNGVPGSDLPDASVVKTTVSGAQFRGWAYYNEENDHVWPDYYETVPSTEGVALKAIFDGTDAGGNTGGGGSGGGGGSQGGGGTTQTGFGIIKGDGTSFIGESKGKNFEGYDEYLVSGVSFTTGETFSLYDPSTLGKWVVDINPYSFSPDPEHGTEDPERVASYLTKGETSYTVNKDFKADLYIQILYQQDRLYIQLA